MAENGLSVINNNQNSVGLGTMGANANGPAQEL
jgi:hypothetical protein